MIKFILGLVTGILGFVGGLLPDSPFAEWITGSDQLTMALGWLNWFVPVSDLLGIFGLYLALLVAWTAIDIALDAAAMARHASWNGGYTG